MGGAQRQAAGPAARGGVGALLARALLVVAVAAAVAVYRGHARDDGAAAAGFDLARPLASLLGPLAGALPGAGEPPRAAAEAQDVGEDAELDEDADIDDDDLDDLDDDGNVEKDEGEDEDARGDARPEAMVIDFVNEWSDAASVMWERAEDDWIQVIPSFRDRVSVNTFVGHHFMFTREGTRDQIGPEVQVRKGQKTYVLAKDAKPRSEVDGPCTDRYARRCAKLAADDECNRNPGWMIVNCPASCDACELLDPAKRCDPAFLNISADHAWVPGDLDRMFERVMQDFADFEPRAVSKPPEGPWLVVFENFISDAEADALVRWGHKLGFERSTDSGTRNERGEQTKKVSQGRTSSNTWCRNECEKDPLVSSVYDRIEQVTQIPRQNFESLQLLKYEVGQFYRTHHDMAQRTRHDAAGPRILTFFLYISDVEEGGETDFPRIDKRVAPRKGSAVLWPSVLDQDPWLQDARTFHAALPVVKGLKYGANAWIHARNFVVPNKYACTGSVS